MAEGFVVVGSTDGMEWPVRPLASTPGEAAGWLQLALRDVGLDEMNPGEVGRLVADMVTTLAEGAQAWTYGEPWDEYGATASWSVAVVRLPHA